jgi:NitT/TauT family transport system substrate-binding protein
VNKGNGRIVIDERDLRPNRQFATTLASRKILREGPDWIRRFPKAHVKLTRSIQENPGAAKKLMNQQIAQLTRKIIGVPILNEAFSRFEVTFYPLPESLQTFSNEPVSSSTSGMEVFLGCAT